MRLYDIVLFLFLFGAVCQTINTIGAFPSQIPASSAVITQAQVNEVSSGITTVSPLNYFFVYQIIVMIGSIVVMGAVAVATIIPLWLSWTSVFGINPLVAIAVIMPVQIGIYWVMINGYYQQFTGHPYGVMK